MDISNNKQLLNILESKITNAEISYLLIPTNFNQVMVKTSCTTLKNINYLIEEYLQSINKENSRGEKILLVFGLLQGLFVAVDALYSLGKAITMDKLIININSNDNLRDIKHIRNDVVGHPTYRFYSQNAIGFCVLDIDHITNTKIKYLTYTFDKDTPITTQKEVDLQKVIENYYLESNIILKQALSFLDIFDEVDILNLIDKIVLLFYRFQKHNKDYQLLDEIYQDYVKLFKVEDDDSSRFLWRLNLIKFLFDYNYSVEEEGYVVFLTNSEIKKVYHLAYNMLKTINSKKRYRNLNFPIPKDFELLHDLIRDDSMLKENIDILHDHKHPLYFSTINQIIKTYKDFKDLKYLINWIEIFVKTNNYNMLYLIGSQLKRSLAT